MVYIFRTQRTVIENTKENAKGMCVCVCVCACACACVCVLHVLALQVSHVYVSSTMSKFPY